MIKAKAQLNNDRPKTYAPLPEGKYTVEVLEIGEWKENIKAVEFINAKDSKGNLLKDENGKIVKDQVKNYKFNTLDLKLKVVDGEHENRYIFGSLTTHDNVIFLTEGFLFAVGVDGLNDINDIYKLGLVGKQLQVETQNQTYTKIEEDKDTGISNPVEKVRTRVKKYIRLPIASQE